MLKRPILRPLKYPLERGVQSTGGGGSAPVNTVAPVISGTAPYYPGATLTTTDGTWTGSPSPTFTYQWRNGGVDIGGATANTYVILNEDQGDTIDCVVTATNASGAVPADSNDLVMFALLTDVAGLSLWLDGADTSTITAVANAVSQWNDKTANAWNMTQGTGANQPLSGTRTVNSRNVVDFDGVSDFMIGTAHAGLLALVLNPITMFVVGVVDNTLLDQSFVIGYNSTPSRRLDIGYDVGGLLMRGMQGTTGVTIPVVVDTNPHALAIRSATPLIYDGVQGVGSNLGSSATIVNFGVGGRSTGAAPRIDGAIGEILIYSSALSNANANIVGDYLKSKWGITWTGL